MSIHHPAVQQQFKLATTEADLRKQINELQAELHMRSVILEALDLDETPDSKLVEQVSLVQAAQTNLWVAQKELEDLTASSQCEAPVENSARASTHKSKQNADPAEGLYRIIGAI
jgi:hypothetical protein